MPESGRPDGKAIAGSVIALLEPELTAEGFDLLDVRVFQGGGRAQVRIYVDLREGGIDLGGCARASRSVGMLLEEADLFPGKYIIEVSSPGIRRPLRRREHFEAAVGQRVDLKVQGLGASRVRGVLTALEGDVLVVAPESLAPDAPDAAPAAAPPAEVRVELGRIREANLDPDFDVQALINADRRRRKDEKQRKRNERKNRRRPGAADGNDNGDEGSPAGGSSAED